MPRKFSHARTSALLSLFLMITTLRISAQVPDPTIAAMAPVQGAGHDYIGIGSETVNPADGTFTFNLPLNLPPGRQVNMPFGLRYASYEQYKIGGNGIGGNVNWWPVPNAPFQFYGWSYLLPTYAAQAYTEDSEPNPNANPPYSSYLYCDGTENYVLRIGDYQDTFSQLRYLWPDSSNAISNFCAVSISPGIGNGDVAFGAAAGALPSAGTHPAMQAVDLSGTTYNFPSYFLDYSGSSNYPTSWGLLATTITDKNGNQLVYTGSQYSEWGNGPGGTQLPTPAGGYKDTLGRQAVSWSGLGSNSGDKVSISGLTGNIVVTWKPVNITFPESGYMISGSAGDSTCTLIGTAPQQIQGVSEIDLPNGQNYTFGYDPIYGTVNKITFPDGGYVRYVWGTYPSSSTTQVQWVVQYSGASEYCYFVYDTPAITDRYVSFDGSSENLHQHFAFTPMVWNVNSGGIPYWNTKQTTVQTTDALTGLVSYAVYNYVPEYSSALSGSPQGPPVEASILYQDTTQKTLKTVNKTWYNPYRMVGEQTILDNGQGDATLRCWNGYVVVGLYEYGFQGEGSKPADPSCQTLPFSVNGTTLSAGLKTSAIGPLRRQTATVYHTFPTGPSPTEPDSVTVSDGTGNQLQQTTYAYDASSLVSSGTKIGLVAAPGSRGNATSISHWLNTTSAFLTTTYTYYDNGNVHTKVDACNNKACTDMTGTNHTTTYVYTDSYSSGKAPGQTNAYLTKVTDPLAHTESFEYDYSSGHLTTFTDQNKQPTSYTYNDPLSRLTMISYPDQGQTTYAYNDSAYNSSTSNPSPSITTTKAITSTQNEVTVTGFDGMGHKVDGILSSDPVGPVYTTTSYDGLGRPYKVSNPYRSTTDPTFGLTVYAYDALGRTTQVTHPDGSFVATSYTGRATSVLDEGNGTAPVQRITQVDGLGRLMYVCEVTGSTQMGTTNASPAKCGLDISGTGFLTTYGYDSLNNLLSVQQGAENRSFTYDSLSRLLCAANPETSGGTSCPYPDSGIYTPGTSRYAYDANGNIFQRIRPAPNQTNPATTVTTNYSYDALNRETGIAYSDLATPSVTKHYDTTLELGLGLNNTIGRLSAEFVTSPSSKNVLSEKVFSYDPLGRVIDNSQCTANNCASSTAYSITYSYNLLGQRATATNGQAVTFHYTYDAAARLTALTSSLSATNYPGSLLSGVTYSPFGSPTAATLGSALNEASAYDCRGRILFFISAVYPAVPSISGSNTPGCPNTTAMNLGMEGSVLNASLTDRLKWDLLPPHLTNPFLRATHDPPSDFKSRLAGVLQ